MAFSNVDLKKLKKLRIEMKLSHEAVSRILGFESRQAYFYKEKGKNRFSATEIKMLADFYKVSVDSLYEDHEPTEQTG